MQLSLQQLLNMLCGKYKEETTGEVNKIFEKTGGFKSSNREQGGHVKIVLQTQQK